MVRSVNPKREKKELGYFCIFLHLVFGRVFLPQLQLCTNLSKNRKIKQHCQVTLMRAFTHFIPTIKPTNERNSFRYVFSRVSNVSETNFRHAPGVPERSEGRHVLARQQRLLQPWSHGHTKKGSKFFISRVLYAILGTE